MSKFKNFSIRELYIDESKVPKVNNHASNDYVISFNDEQMIKFYQQFFEGVLNKNFYSIIENLRNLTIYYDEYNFSTDVLDCQQFDSFLDSPLYEQRDRVSNFFNIFIKPLLEIELNDVGFLVLHELLKYLAAIFDKNDKVYMIEEFLRNLNHKGFDKSLLLAMKNIMSTRDKNSGVSLNSFFNLISKILGYIRDDNLVKEILENIEVIKKKSTFQASELPALLTLLQDFSKYNIYTSHILNNIVGFDIDFVSKFSKLFFSFLKGICSPENKTALKTYWSHMLNLFYSESDELFIDTLEYFSTFYKNCVSSSDDVDDIGVNFEDIKVRVTKLGSSTSSCIVSLINIVLWSTSESKAELILMYELIPFIFKLFSISDTRGKIEIYDFSDKLLRLEMYKNFYKFHKEEVNNFALDTAMIMIQSNIFYDHNNKALYNKYIGTLQFFIKNYPNFGVYFKNKGYDLLLYDLIEQDNEISYRFRKFVEFNEAIFN